ncbi:TniQ family protein [Bosea sp. TAF32]|uniref:TniQ family protein n=1 Tax=Bosea sp. TAF32 TaxID=3237482 RepID=UPI003F8F0C88
MEEPAYGLLARTIEKNLPGTFSARLADLGAYGPISVDKANVAEIARLCHADPKALERSTPWGGPKYATVLRERFRRDDFTVSRRRWCSVCLSEHGCHLGWWDLTIVTTCPRHGVALVDRCSCGSEIHWKRQVVFSRCNCGRPLAEAASVSLVGDEGSSDRYVVGRLTGVDPKRVPILDRLPLLDVIEVLRNVGHLSIRPMAKRRALETEMGFRRLLDAGYEGVESFPSSFRALLDSKLAEAVVPEGKFGSHRVYGHTFSRWLADKEPASLRGALSTEVRAHAARHLKLQTPTLFGAAVDRQRVGLIEAAAICGVNYERMRRILNSKGFLPTGAFDRSASFERSVIEEIASTLRGAVTFKSVADELNVGLQRVRQLIEAGVIPQPILDKKGSSYMLMPADTARVLMSRLLSAVTPEADTGQRKPIPLATKSFGISIADVVAEILTGSIAAVGVLQEERGLNSILVDVAGKRTARRIATSETMTAGDIIRTYGVSGEDAAGLLKIGAIAAKRGGHAWEVDKEVACEFFRVHTYLGPYAKRLKTSVRYLAHRLEAAGFQPAYAPPSTASNFYKRADVEAYLNQEGWPPKDWRVECRPPEGTYVTLAPGSALARSVSQRP